MIITLDGPAGSGKSTLSKLIATKLGFSYLDTGAMYRAITLALLQEKILNDSKSIEKLLKMIRIRFEGERIFLNDNDISVEIRKPFIDQKVPEVAGIIAVRKAMTALQKQIARSGNYVVEGRDMGSMVFPDAKYKFYLDASPEERAKRRYIQMRKRGETPEDPETILKEIQVRDKKDKTRTMAPLTIPKGAVVINTDDLDLSQVLSKILAYFPADIS